MAHLSGDPRLKAALADGRDFFRHVASAWHKGKAAEQVTPTEREQTKQLCYGLTYGMGVQQLAASLKLAVPQAKALKSAFHSAFPVLGQFADHLKATCRRRAYAVTIAGVGRPSADLRPRSTDALRSAFVQACS